MTLNCDKCSEEQKQGDIGEWTWRVKAAWNQEIREGLSKEVTFDLRPKR